MSTSPARTLKGSRRFQRRHDRRSPSPQWQFLRGFLKNPVMVGSIIPSSKVLIDKMLSPVDWDNTKLFVEYGPGVGTFTRPILERLTPDATLVTIGGSGVPATVQVRLSIGTPGDAGCTATTSVVTRSGSTAQVTATEQPGAFCASLADVGNLSGPASFTLTVDHP